jgi:hypothetical protein
MFLANTFSYSQRRTLAEHAYQQTRRMLRSRRGRLAAQLAPHGVRIDVAVLDQPRRLLSPVRAATRHTAQALHRLEEVLDDLDDLLVTHGA